MPDNPHPPSSPGQTQVIARAVIGFLATHQQALLGLLETGNGLDRYQVEVHTLAGVSRLFPAHAKFMRIYVSPATGGGGSTVMSSALMVGEQWFLFEGPRTREEIFADMQKTAAKGARKSTQFEWHQESYLPLHENTKIQTYLVQHFLPLVARLQAQSIDENTPPAQSTPRPSRL